LPTFRLVLEYDGTEFEGWQRQPEGHRTVQGVLGDAAAALGRVERLMGAGRTDAGVHAAGQVASLSLETALDAPTLLRALNGHLPGDVAVVGCKRAPAGFDARRDASGKLYRYVIWNGAQASPLRRRRAWHVRGPLGLSAMAEAARPLVGTHDFASFAAAGSAVETTTRRLDRLEVVGEAGAEVVVEAAGGGFLRHMVRNLVGTLVEVGQGRREPGAMAGLLADRDRTRAGPTAPACGLTLVHVSYPAAAIGDSHGGGQEER
jgi:tRNA pseudouridine38-40 synthase